MRFTRKDLAQGVGLLGVVALVVGAIMIAGAREPTPIALARGQVRKQARPPGDSAQAALTAEEQPSAPAREVQQQATAPRPAAPCEAGPKPVAKPQPSRAAPAAYASGALPPFPSGLPPLGVSPTAGWSGPSAALRAGPPPSVLWLAGVIQGESKLAVLRRGESRYLVKEGDSVEGRYRVIKIAADRVALQRGRRTISLRLGQY
jgi:hypothetical protein